MMANVAIDRYATTTFRRGVAAPEKSSLSVFVAIGLAVGIFAFALMTYCLPDPLEKVAAREAAAAIFPPPPVLSQTMPIAPRPVIDAAPVVVVTPMTAAITKPHARRATPSSKKPKTVQLPSNPYGP